MQRQPRCPARHAGAICSAGTKTDPCRASAASIRERQRQPPVVAPGPGGPFSLDAGEGGAPDKAVDLLLALLAALLGLPSALGPRDEPGSVTIPLDGDEGAGTPRIHGVRG